MNLHDYIQEGHKAVPEKFLEFAYGKKEKKRERVKVENCEEGKRNDYLFRLSSGHRARGFSYDEIFPQVWGVNLERCHPPLERSEVETIVHSVCEKYEAGSRSDETPPRTDTLLSNGIFQNEECWVKPLGYRESDYFYTSSSNPEIVRISVTQHNQLPLLGLLPDREFWGDKFGTGKQNAIKWDNAASCLIEACHKKGQYSEWNHRGRGAWRYQGETVFNLGRSIYNLSTGQSSELGRINSGHIFTVSKNVAPPRKPLPETFEPGKILEVCNLLNWENKWYGNLLAGWISLAPMCGALSWRPHIWITGGKGTGKTTTSDFILKPALSEFAIFAQGNTTEAGLRQHVKCDAVPVVFDEAETGDRGSDSRVRRVIEWFRQCSSETDAMVFKGTAGGDGMAFKPSAMGCLLSIRVNLTEEADKSRFTVLELKRNEVDNWEELKPKLLEIDSEYGHCLWVYVMDIWKEIQTSMVRFENHLAKKFDRRIGQQYAPLIAGAYHLIHREAVPKELCGSIADAYPVSGLSGKETEDSDEMECLEYLSELSIEAESDGGFRDRQSIGELVRLNRGAKYLALYGIFVLSDRVCLSKGNPQLNKLFEGSKWGRLWNKALLRVPGAKDDRPRIPELGNKQKRCIMLPAALFHCAADE